MTKLCPGGETEGSQGDEKNPGPLDWNAGSTVSAVALGWGVPRGTGGTRCRRGFSGQERGQGGSVLPQGQEQRRDPRDYRYGVREEGAGGLHVLREGAGSPPFPLPDQFAHIHQGRKTISLIFQIIISLRLKWSTNNNYTGNTSVETAPGKPGQVTTSRGTSSSSFPLQEAFLDTSPPHGLPFFLARSWSSVLLAHALGIGAIRSSRPKGPRGVDCGHQT